ncbi:CPBP family glutamic-type intramembrane protease [Flexibacterium corallicola]|uniref:CPBP family glutamic-type intramembrane protease n=1 Tax=Flexibacterium corallicola TaxID=3037259 RepID=UPI00286F16E0|nr:CPBP family glutamic-type intramembrane protease [Pseudovibrio sp. M1P-2-3]
MSLPVIIIMLIMRKVSYPQEKVFAFYFLEVVHPRPVLFIGNLLLYIFIFAPLQCYITRSGYQSVLTSLVPRSLKVRALAIIAIALSFGVAHLSSGLKHAGATMLIALYWGIMFEIRKSIIALSVSHALIGFIGIFWLGLNRLG